MIPKNDKTKNHYPYYYFGKVVDSTDVANSSALIKTFDQRLYINYGNGLCVKRMKNASSHVNKVIELELIPITSIYGVPSGKCGFTTLSAFPRRFPRF